MRVFMMTTVCIPATDKQTKKLCNKIIKFNPDKIVLISNMEVYIEGQWGVLIKHLKNFCQNKNIIIDIVSPTDTYDGFYVKKTPNIRLEKSYGCMIPSWKIMLNNYNTNIPIDVASYAAPLFNMHYEKGKTFCFYNWRAADHRVKMLDALVRDDILKYGHVTFHNPDPQNIPWKYHDGSKLIDPSEEYDKQSSAHFRFPKTYYDSFMDLVAETAHEEGLTHMTEKTMRPIAYFKPFLVLSCSGFHRDYLCDFFGLELYDEIFDYSFDKEHSIDDRINGIIENIIRLKDYNKNQLISAYKTIRPKMIRNKNRLTELFYDKNRIVPKCLSFLQEPGHQIAIHAGDYFFDYLREIQFTDYTFEKTLNDYL